MIDINKEYKTRDGQDVSIVRIYSESWDFRLLSVMGYIGEEEDYEFWNLEGKNDLQRESRLDLVEVVETEAMYGASK